MFAEISLIFAVFAAGVGSDPNKRSDTGLISLKDHPEIIAVAGPFNPRFGNNRSDSDQFSEKNRLEIPSAIPFVPRAGGNSSDVGPFGQDSKRTGNSPLNVRIGTLQQQPNPVQQQVQQQELPSDAELEALRTQAEFSNDLAHRLVRECPELSCSGLDCAFANVNGCKMCACPIGSPARGCDKLPDKFWNELMESGCPNENEPNGQRTPARRVIRWYRYTDPEKGFSECRYYMFPYCNDSDFNFWRSPRTKAECSYYCFRHDKEVETVTQVPL